MIALETYGVSWNLGKLATPHSKVEIRIHPVLAIPWLLINAYDWHRDAYIYEVKWSLYSRSIWCGSFRCRSRQIRYSYMSYLEKSYNDCSLFWHSHRSHQLIRSIEYTSHHPTCLLYLPLWSWRLTTAQCQFVVSVLIQPMPDAGDTPARLSAWSGTNLRVNRVI